MTKEIIATYGMDIDSVAGWIGSYGGADSPSDSTSAATLGCAGRRWKGWPPISATASRSTHRCARGSTEPTKAPKACPG